MREDTKKTNKLIFYEYLLKHQHLDLNSIFKGVDKTKSRTNKHKYFHGYNTLYKLLYLSLIDKAPERKYCASLIENIFEYLRLAYYNMVGITLRETGKKIIDKNLYKYDRLKYIVNILKEKKCIVHWKKSNKESVTFNVLLLGEISNFNKQFAKVKHYYNKIVWFCDKELNV